MSKLRPRGDPLLTQDGEMQDQQVPLVLHLQHRHSWREGSLPPQRQPGAHSLVLGGCTGLSETRQAPGTLPSATTSSAPQWGSRTRRLQPAAQLPRAGTTHGQRGAGAGSLGALSGPLRGWEARFTRKVFKEVQGKKRH